MNAKSSLDKLDPYSRSQLRRGDLQGPIEALIRTETPPSAEEDECLKRVGWKTRTAAAQVISGTVASSQELEELIELPFVRQVEISRQLFDEKKEPE